MLPWLNPVIPQLIGTIVGAALAALFGLWQARHIRSLERADEIKGLLSAFRGEIDVVAELAEIDAFLPNNESTAILIEKIRRMGAARTVFLSSSGRLGLLPSGMSGSLVRFYGRLEVKSDMMKSMIRDRSVISVDSRLKFSRGPDADEYERHRTEIETEARSLMRDIDKELDKL